MNANRAAGKILKELHFDFANFTLERFMWAVEQAKGREMIVLSWDMRSVSPWHLPYTLFGAWLSDDEEPREYIFYHENLHEIHRIHIQLRQLSHILWGHPTYKINLDAIAAAAAGQLALPFRDLPILRANNRAQMEMEANALTCLIVKNVLRRHRLYQLFR
ncbi:MAG: hypothetical protein WA821_10585 [Anaerolineales bacterium]